MAASVCIARMNPLRIPPRSSTSLCRCLGLNLRLINEDTSLNATQIPLSGSRYFCMAKIGLLWIKRFYRSVVEAHRCDGGRIDPSALLGQSRF